MTTPARGIRNNNPFNIDYHKSNNWDGQLGIEDHKTPRFARFSDPKFGIRAGIKLIRNYNRLYDIKDINGIIDRFAPPIENNTKLYKEAVCQRLGIDADTPLDFQSKDHMRELSKAIIKHECGEYPYNDAIMDEALELAMGK